MAVHTPQGTTQYNITTYARTIAGATYQKMVAIPRFDDEGRPLGSLVLRKHVRMTAASLSQSDDGSSLNATTMADTPVTLTPAGAYLMVAQSENEWAQLDFDLSAEARDQQTQAMAEYSDTAVLADVASFTNNLTTTKVDGPSWRQVLGRVGNNTYGVAVAGYAGSPEVFGIFTMTQLPAWGEIPEYNQANLRGDDQNPYVTGVQLKGSGASIYFTTAVAQDGNGWHNFVGIGEAIAVAWNKHTQIEDQKYNLQRKVIAFNNFAHGVFHNARGFDWRTTASQL